MKNSYTAFFKATMLLIVPVHFFVTSLNAQSSLPTKSVSIFKNGSCMFTKEGLLPLINNELRLAVPGAINSTYWLNTPGERLIRSIKYKNENIKVQREVSNLIDLLELNVGKTLSFDYLRSNPLRMGGQHVDQVASTTLLNLSGKILGVNRAMNSFKIEDKGGTHYFDFSVLQGSNYSIADAVDTRSVDSTVRYAIVSPTKLLDEMKIQEISLQSGIQWIPSYYLKLNSAKELRIEMKALLENFSMEDITNAETEVVVGVPQLYFSKVLDPSYYSTMTQLSPIQPAYDYAANIALQNRAVAESMRAGLSRSTVDAHLDGSGSAALSYNTSFEAESEQSNDIFVYKLGAISLEKNSKAAFPVFATTLEYKDVHECIIPDVVNFENTRMVNTREDTYDVFHSLELHNTTDYPLTTAGVVVLDEKSHFLAQDLLKYIPKGGKGQIRLSKAINVTLKSSEEELNRSDNVKRISKINYGRVSIKGSVGIDNFDNKDLIIKVKKNVSGLVSHDAAYKVTKQTQGFGINPHSEITWEVKIPAGEHRDLSYEYETMYRQ